MFSTFKTILLVILFLNINCSCCATRALSSGAGAGCRGDGDVKVEKRLYAIDGVVRNDAHYRRDSISLDYVFSGNGWPPAAVPTNAHHAPINNVKNPSPSLSP